MSGRIAGKRFKDNEGSSALLTLQFLISHV